MHRTRLGSGAAVATLAVVLAVVLPLVLVAVLPGPADAAAVTADSNGGVRGVPPRPAPAFDLVDQSGVRVSLAGLRGKLVVLTFLDAVCNTDCPLIANQLAIADRRLGPLADRVELVAVDSNPVFRFRRDVAAFTIPRPRRPAELALRLSAARARCRASWRATGSPSRCPRSG